MKSLRIAFLAALVATPAVAEDDIKTLWNNASAPWLRDQYAEADKGCDVVLKVRNLEPRKKAVCLARKGYVAARGGDDKTAALPPEERAAACTMEFRGVNGVDNNVYDAIPDSVYAGLAACGGS